ncbi:methyltransferase family protein [Flagellimonas marinaquae]|uniref:methyltransferase family protein n=1 Tax=Flagellimonas marinaquae TaxID=254955 RepID=UPI002075DDC1|nr:isoprenylcysteine carboxylmethyltransferase family protein [Allomuricauda aquimarina]USD25332.1 isoprenylcysteine carboxylmethyltransferase family protein [Allomuricauda aquimarina]
MKLKVPPALVMLIFGGTMFLLDRFLPVGEFDFFGRNQLAWILFVLGVIVGLLAVLQFWTGKTSLDPMHPQKTSRLMTKGVYNFSRNPMYLGLLLLLLALGLWLGNAFNTLVSAGFVSYMNHFQIQPEEDMLQQKFGKEYRFYCKLTRRWF